jgi:hypothetical protein
VLFAVCSVVIGSAGDVACQTLVEKNDRFDYRRLFNMAFLSGALVGPTLHVWYGYLARAVPGTEWSAVIKRLAFDQVCLLMFAAVRAPACVITVTRRVFRVCVVVTSARVCANVRCDLLCINGRCPGRPRASWRPLEKWLG